MLWQILKFIFVLIFKTKQYQFAICRCGFFFFFLILLYLVYLVYIELLVYVTLLLILMGGFFQKYFLLFFSLFLSLLDSSCLCRKPLHIFAQVTEALLIFYFFPLFFFRVGSFCWFFFRFTNPFAISLSTTLKELHDFFSFLDGIFGSNFPFF